MGVFVFIWLVVGLVSAIMIRSGNETGEISVGDFLLIIPTGPMFMLLSLANENSKIGEFLSRKF